MHLQKSRPLKNEELLLRVKTYAIRDGLFKKWVCRILLWVVLDFLLGGPPVGIKAAIPFW